MNIEYSQQFLKQRRFWTVLPLIVLPFVTLVFWLMGGGTVAPSQSIVKAKGLNTQLPDANLKNPSVLDKLSFYAMADRDSVKRAEQWQMDPNYQPSASPGKTSNVNSSEASADLINQKITRLQRQINEPAVNMPTQKQDVVESAGDIDRLQQMVASINPKKSDPEMDALNSTLDKLLEIQHPERIKKENGAFINSKVFAVKAGGSNRERSYFGKSSENRSNGFLSEGDEAKDSLKSGTILAVVHNEQILFGGSVIKLRLLQDVFVNDERIPAGSFVFGNSSIDNERLQVAVSSIQFQHHLYPVALTVFDMDGLAGINIPGSAGREVIKQSTDQGIQAIGGLSFDPSLKAQAAAAGVNAAKSLLGKSVKRLRVTIKAGYMLLLKDLNDKNNER